MFVGKSSTRIYWKHGELKRIKNICGLNVYLIRAGKTPITSDNSKILELCCKIIGKDDITHKDWFEGSRGKSEHPAFAPITGDKNLYGRIWE